MGESNGSQFYICLQFVGFMLQMFPAVILLFAPYRQEQMRVSRKRLLTVFGISTTGVSVLGALFLGHIYWESGNNLQARICGNLIFFVYLLIGSAAYFLSLRRSTKTGVLTYMLVLQYEVAMYIIAEMLVKHFPAAFRAQMPYSVGDVFVYAAGAGLTLPAVYHFLVRVGKERFRSVNSKGMFLITGSSVIMLAATVCSLQMEVIIDAAQANGEINLFLSIWLGCMVIISFLAYFIYFRCLRIEEEKADINMRLAAEEMQYKALAEKINEDRRMSHNMRHHFRMLTTLADQHHYAELQDYLKKYTKEWEEISKRNVCVNPMFNSILAYYFSRAEAEGIEIETDIKIREFYGFDITDMTVLLGNAMENALEACETSESSKPFIRVMMKQIRKALLIQIENSCKNGSAPGREDGRVQSTKQGRSRGYGISSMDMIARKYQGSLEYWQEEGQFVLRVVLNIPESVTEGS